MTTTPTDLLTPRVLIVDDERQIHASVRLRLGKNYDLTCCLDAREALAKLESETFDLILMDLQMPGMGGIDATAAIRGGERVTGHPVEVKTRGKSARKAAKR